MTDILGLDMEKDKLTDCIKSYNSSCRLRRILISNLMGKSNRRKKSRNRKKIREMGLTIRSNKISKSRLNQMPHQESY